VDYRVRRFRSNRVRSRRLTANYRCKLVSNGLKKNRKIFNLWKAHIF
jgi:hypothetical protein